MAAFGTDEFVGWFYELGRGRFDATLLTNQLIAIVGIIGWTVALMYPFFRVLDKLNWLKASIQSEIVGLDEKYMSNSRHEAKVEIDEDVNNYTEEVNKIRKRRMKKDSNLAESVRSLNTSSVGTFKVSTIESVEMINTATLGVVDECNEPDQDQLEV